MLTFFAGSIGWITVWLNRNSATILPRSAELIKSWILKAEFLAFPFSVERRISTDVYCPMNNILWGA